MMLGEQIKLGRERAGLTQQQLALRIGVTRAAISQWESGETKNLRLHNLFRCAQVLHMSPQALALNEADTATGIAEDQCFYRWRSASALARDCAEDILAASADGRIDDRLLRALHQMVRALTATRCVLSEQQLGQDGDIQRHQNPADPA